VFIVVLYLELSISQSYELLFTFMNLYLFQLHMLLVWETFIKL